MGTRSKSLESCSISFTIIIIILEWVLANAFDFIESSCKYL